MRAIEAATMAKRTRPKWILGVKKTPAAAPVSVRRSNGSKVVYRVPRTSLIESADRAEKIPTKA